MTIKKVTTNFLLTIFLFASFVSAQNKTSDRAKLWEKEIDAFAEIDRRQTPPENAVLFVGSSSIRLWENLRTSFPSSKVINRGFGGSRLEDVNHYFDEIIAPYRPKTIVLYAGENDVNEGVAPEKVAEDYAAFSKMTHEKLPNTKILYISLKPSPARWKLADQYRKTNKLIEIQIQKDGRSQFIDVFNAMLGASGKPLPDIFREDGLHMNEKGYAIWRAILEKYVK